MAGICNRPGATAIALKRATVATCAAPKPSAVELEEATCNTMMTSDNQVFMLLPDRLLSDILVRIFRADFVPNCVLQQDRQVPEHRHDQQAVLPAAVPTTNKSLFGNEGPRVMF